MSHATDWLYHARLYAEWFGLSIIPMAEDKKPMIPWMDYQKRIATPAEILSWKRHNLAIVTGAVSNIVVVDCESEADAIWFSTERGKSPSIVKTKRGYHLYFRHPGQRVKNGQKIENRYDVRGDGGYVLAPPSIHSDGHYEWRPGLKLVPTCLLPVFKMEWRPEPLARELEAKEITDGAAYIAKIMAISGQAGHDNTYRAACILRAAGMNEAEAMLVMQAWNRTNADPPWSDRELLHKLKGAYA